MIYIMQDSMVIVECIGKIGHFLKLTARYKSLMKSVIISLNLPGLSIFIQ